MKIQIIIGSVRQGRIGPQIAQWVRDCIVGISEAISADIIDLAEWYLPMDDEPFMPSSGQYIQPHTQKWSEKINQGQMMIFVFPQYNWGYPAALKNAIDHLYHEWKDKPALMVSYANRGGAKAATQLKQVLEGVNMQPLNTAIEIKLSELEFEENGMIIQPAEGLSQYVPALHEALALVINSMSIKDD
ncbi:TPA: NADPH-dependent FMN reductase [Providencia rettgeri]